MNAAGGIGLVKTHALPVGRGHAQIARPPERSVCEPIFIESALTPLDVLLSAPPQPTITNIATITNFFIAGPH